MHLEVEQKFRVTRLDVVREKLIQLGATFDAAIDQADSYFSHPARDFASTDEALRLRQVGQANYITYKGPKIDAETKTRGELELALPWGGESLERCTELLLALGFGPVATVLKRREAGRLAWEGLAIEIALDDVEGVGTFVELEIAADESGLGAAKIRIASLAKQLDLTDIERRSYLEMLLAVAP